MKLIVSSDRENLINAEFVGHFYVLQTGDSEEYGIYADGDFLSRHRKKEKAILELNNLGIVLSNDKLPLLYYMEDTI